MTTQTLPRQSRFAAGDRRARAIGARPQGRDLSFRRRQFSSRPSGGLSGRPVGRGQDHDWRSGRAASSTANGPGRQRLAAQDWLSTVVGAGRVGSHGARDGRDGRIRAAGDAAASIAALSDPAIRIVSLTITEGGYSSTPPPVGSIPSIPTSLPMRANRKTRRPFSD